MTTLIAGLVLFLGLHGVRVWGDGLRTRAIASLGLVPWKLGYAFISLAGLWLIASGYGQARLAPVVLWQLPAGLAHPVALLVLVAFLFVAATYVPRNRLKAAVGHPMLVGVKIWAFAHLLVNGTLADLLLFGGFLAWAVALYAVSRRRDRREGVRPAAGTLAGDLATLAVGGTAFVGFALWGHLHLIGVAPFG